MYFTSIVIRLLYLTFFHEWSSKTIFKAHYELLIVMGKFLGIYFGKLPRKYSRYWLFIDNFIFF